MSPTHQTSILHLSFVLTHTPLHPPTPPRLSPSPFQPHPCFLFSLFIPLFHVQAKYDQMQAARREKILPYVHSDSNLLGAGVHHMPHSKSDANFFSNGGVSHLSNGLAPPPADAAANGHILLREWHDSSEGITLIPVASHAPTQQGARGASAMKLQVEHSPSQRLVTSRNIHHV